jgi:hypothetical protein
LKDTISAKGYANAILVLNMKRFVHPEDQVRFEMLRGTQEFGDVLRHDWQDGAGQQSPFKPMKIYKAEQTANNGGIAERMLTEDIGFATGIFRSLVIEKYNFPTYHLDKSKIVFPDNLTSNFQFKNLFLRVWERWEIFIRPSYTGFFVIRLLQNFKDNSRTLLQLAQDAQHLQETLDVPSAINWLKGKRIELAGQPEELEPREKSVKALLDWVGSSEEESGEILYYPVQWKLAMEVACWFIQSIVQTIPTSRGDIRLVEPPPSLSIPLHDSYLIYHIETLLASANQIKRAGKASSNNAQIPVNINDIRNSYALRHALSNLMEGTVLKNDSPDKTAFPDLRWSITDSILDQNQASWNDELCLLSARTAIIMPSSKWAKYELAISTVPSATLKVKYPRYWGAIERMIEMVLEVRVFAQLIESISYDLLGEMVDVAHKARAQIVEGDIHLDHTIPTLTTQAAHLRRTAALVQSLSHPQLWSRAEYSIRKAEYLFEQLGISQTLEHIERNIQGINNIVDHVDEWYLADLSEKNNQKTTLISIGLAAASGMLTLLILPSFWADLNTLIFEKPAWRGFLELIKIFGTATGGIIMTFALYLIWRGVLRKPKKFWAMLREYYL